MANEVMKYLNDDKTVITLPVPLGTELFQVTTRCGDFCTFQEELFDKHFPPIKEGRCGQDKPCHTVYWHVYKIKLKFSNLETVLEQYGTWIFPTEEAAQKRAAEIVERNRKTMRELGFSMTDVGHGFTDAVSDNEKEDRIQ